MKWRSRGPLGRVRLSALLAASLIIVIVGCKLQVVVPPGGRVESESGAYHCVPSHTCKIDVIDLFFDETFKAEPDDGYYFRRWENGDRLLCGNSYSMECHLTTSAFEGNAALESILESGEVFRLQPSFGQGVCEISIVDDYDEEGNEIREEAQKCTIPGLSEPVRQGVVKTYKNNVLVSIAGWDQGTMQGNAKDYYDNGTALREARQYNNGRLEGSQQKYDESGRIVLSAAWKNGQLNGKYVETDYALAEFLKDLQQWDPSIGVKVSTSYYRNGKKNGPSTIVYPLGDWENTEWVDGVQQGVYEVGIRGAIDLCSGNRFVYTVVDGKVTAGASYWWNACASTGEGGGIFGSMDKADQGLMGTWKCKYHNGVLDEDQCYRHNYWGGPM